METDDIPAIRKKVIAAAAVSLLGLIIYAVKQEWTPNAIIGAFAELLYMLYIYVLMPFEFSGLLIAMGTYAADRLRGSRERDIAFAVMSAVSLAAASYVTVCIGEIGIIESTVIFLIIRLVRKYI